MADDHLKKQCIAEQTDEYDNYPEYKKSIIRNNYNKDTSIISNFLINYIDHYKDIDEIIRRWDELGSSQSNSNQEIIKSRLNYFNGLSDKIKEHFLYAYRYQIVDRFNKFNNAIKYAIILHHLDLYDAHSELVNKFFDYCVEIKKGKGEKVGVERPIHIVSPSQSSSSPYARQAWSESPSSAAEVIPLKASSKLSVTDSSRSSLLPDNIKVKDAKAWLAYMKENNLRFSMLTEDENKLFFRKLKVLLEERNVEEEPDVESEEVDGGKYSTPKKTRKCIRKTKRYYKKKKCNKKRNKYTKKRSR